MFFFFKFFGQKKVQFVFKHGITWQQNESEIALFSVQVLSKEVLNCYELNWFPI